jgi:PEP-CTERM motif
MPQSMLRAALGLVFMGLVAPTAAHATTIQWTLTGAVFNDGATAFGSFDYDAATQSLSNFDITTTAGTFIIIDSHGSVSGGHHWLDPDGLNPPYPAAGFAVQDFPLPADFTNTEFLALGFASPLTNAGGTIALTPGGEGFCVNAVCSIGDYQRHFTAGSVVGTALPDPVPEPATLTLTALGLAGAVARFRRRRGERVNDSRGR